MTEFTTLRINRAAPTIPGLADPSYWLRIEQDQEEDLVTQGEVAEMLDKLYDLDPCIVVEEENPDAEPEEQEAPDQEKLYKTAKEVFGGDLMACQSALAGDYTAVIKVYRSHPDEAYKLVLSAGDVTGTVPTQEERIDTMPVSSATSIELEYPVSGSIAAGWLGAVIGETGIIAAPEIKRRGNLLYWDAQATGTVRAEYTTEYDRVTVDVPGVPSSPGSDVGESQDVKIVAFYHFMVFQGEISKPDEDNTVTAGDLKQLCGYNKSGQLDVLEDDDEPLQEPPEPPKYGCQKDNPDLGVPATYKKLCCEAKAPPFITCLLWTTPNSASGKLEQETIDKYLAINKNTEFIPVTPRGAEGCGTIYYHLRVDRKNCCADVIPLSPHPDNPTSIGAGDVKLMQVLNGRLDDAGMLWRASGGLFFENGLNQIRATRGVNVYAPTENFCAVGTVRVDDGCSVVSMTLDNESPPTALTIPPADRVASPGMEFNITGEGGLPDYHWAVEDGDVTLLGSVGSSALFLAGPDFCGSATITLTDGCAAIATCIVRSTLGYWRYVDADPYTTHCEFPAAAREVADADYNIAGGKYRAHKYDNFQSPCGVGINPCGDGNYIIGLSHESLCAQSGGIWREDKRCYLGESCWISGGHYIDRLQEWVCSE